MTRYNPTLRARDLKKTNGALRNQLAQSGKVESDAYVEGVKHGSLVHRYRAERTFEAQRSAYKAELKRRRLVLVALLTLAIIGWLV